jgi:hypothetical protein
MARLRWKQIRLGWKIVRRHPKTVWLAWKLARLRQQTKRTFRKIVQFIFPGQ